MEIIVGNLIKENVSNKISTEQSITILLIADFLDLINYNLDVLVYKKTGVF